MILVAIGVEEDPLDVIDYGQGLVLISAAKGMNASPVEVINGKIGCAQVVGGGGLVAAAPHFPPPPPLPNVRLTFSNLMTLDPTGTFISFPNNVVIPVLPWPAKTAPQKLADVFPTLGQIQQKSGLKDVIYHLFNIVDPTAGKLNQRTLAIPVAPDQAFLKKAAQATVP